MTASDWGPDSPADGQGAAKLASSGTADGLNRAPEMTEKERPSSALRRGGEG